MVVNKVYRKTPRIGVRPDEKSRAVTVHARRPETGAIIPDSFRDHFPVGVYVGMGSTWNSADGTVNHPDQLGGWKTMLRGNQATGTQGLFELNLPYICIGVGPPYFQEVVTDLPGALEGSGRKAWMVAGVNGRMSPSWDTGLDGLFYPGAFANTREVVDPITEDITALYADHPSVLAYSLGDDIGPTNNGPKFVTAVDSFAEIDPLRPATGTIPHIDTVTAAQNLQLMMTYRYAVGRYGDNTESEEGDFHRASFAIDGSVDFVDELRRYMDATPDGCATWWILGTHFTGDVTVTGITRWPTVREMRKMFWNAVGEGVKGVFWFVWTDLGASEGLGGPNRSSERAVMKELSERLAPGIRSILLGCEKVADEFAASGGGKSYAKSDGYADAYISTLAHKSGDRYVIICNNATESDDIVVTSGTHEGGRLVNLETGAWVMNGGTVTLPALDGSIWRYDPWYGVPHWEPDYTVDVETWWASHWANPASDTYIPVGDVKTHPNEVVVAPGDLQDAIDAAPNYTTFRLEAGLHPPVEVIGRRGLHFISDDPDDRATVTSFVVFGTEKARWYSPLPETNPQEMWGLQPVITNRAGVYDQEVYDAWADPSNDLIWRGLDFDGSSLDPVLWNTYQYYDANSNFLWKPDHMYENCPIMSRVVRDCLVEDCTFSNYVISSFNANTNVECPDPVPQGGTPAGHPGLMWSGNAQQTNIIVRGNTATLKNNASGGRYPWAGFADGARGVCFVANRIHGAVDGKGPNNGYFLFLTNDDFTDQYGEQTPRINTGSRNARYNVIALNEVGPGWPNVVLVGFTGFSNLCTDNIVHYGSPGEWNIGGVTGRCSRQFGKGHVYNHFGNVFKNNDIRGTSLASTGAVGVQGYDGILCTGLEGQTDAVKRANPFRGRTGGTIVKNNTAQGTVSEWLVNDDDTEGTDVVTGNTP